ncbi:MAG: hypothetical protein WKF91_20245 [Segetibacter sp.]
MRKRHTTLYCSHGGSRPVTSVSYSNPLLILARQLEHRLPPLAAIPVTLGEIGMNSHLAINHTPFTLLIIICFLSSCGDRIKILSYKKCHVTYRLYKGGEKELYLGHHITDEMELEAAQRKLAACLCEWFIKTKDTAIRDKIIELYNENDNYFPPSTSITTNNIDSIIKHRKELFAATILID